MSAPAPPALETRELSKTYRLGFRMRPVVALAGLDLRVEPGAIFGFVGPNGAGKTTAIKMLAGLIAPSSGEAAIFGKSVRDPSSRRAIGYLPENPAFHDFLKPLEVLSYMGRLSGLSGREVRRRAEELLDFVGLAHARELTVRKFSKGMVQRLGLAQAMLHDPPFLVLDEPMSGLDPIGRKDVRDVVVELGHRGKTIFFSTHILSDVESICDRVGMLLRGRLVAEGSLSTLLDRSIRAVELRCRGLDAATVADVRATALEGKSGPDDVTFTFGDVDSANAAVSRVLAAGGRVLLLQPHRETLEQSFVRLAEADARLDGAPGRQAGA